MRIAINFYLMAEERGFEPPVPEGTTVFETVAFNQLCHSSAKLSNLYKNCHPLSPSGLRTFSGQCPSIAGIA